MKEVVVAHSNTRCAYCNHSFNEQETKFPIKYQGIQHGELRICGYCCVGCKKSGARLEFKTWMVKRDQKRKFKHRSRAK